MPVDGLTASRRCSPLPLLASRRRRPRWMPSGADTVHVTVFSHVLFVLVLMGAMCDGVRLFTIHPIRNAKRHSQFIHIHNSLIIPYPIRKIAITITIAIAIIAISLHMDTCHDSPSSSARSTSAACRNIVLSYRGNLALCPVFGHLYRSEQLGSAGGPAPLREIGQSGCVSECVYQGVPECHIIVAPIY